MSAISLIHRSVHDFPTVSSLYRGLAFEEHEEDIVVAQWRLHDYDAMTSLDTVNDSLAEAKRLEALVSYNILGNGPDPMLEDIAREARVLFKVSCAKIGIMDLGRLWIKASSSVDASLFNEQEDDIPRSRSICAHTLQRSPRSGILVVPDICLEPRFAKGSVVNYGMRFYAGAPIRSPEGAVLGVLSVWDVEPRPHGLSVREQTVLEQLATCVMAHILLA